MKIILKLDVPIEHINHNPELCKECRGECCKSCPCEVFPQDIGDEITIDNLTKFMSNKGYNFDYWDGYFEGIEQPYYIRPATINSINKIVDASYGGMCWFYTPDGCALKDKKPFGAYLLNPLNKGNCKHTGESGKIQSIRAWLPYQEIINKTIQKLQGDISYL